MPPLVPYPVELDVADEPSDWESAGFVVERREHVSLVHLGEITIRLLGHSSRGAGAGGILAWALAGLPPDVTQIQGIPTRATISKAPAPIPQHPNGACGVDHIVMMSQDWQRSVEVLRGIGMLPLRQTNKVRAGVTQVIYRPSSTIIELVGAKIPPKTTHLWGLTLVSADVDGTHNFLKSSTKPPWPAVQPGRRMTVLQGAAHGVSVPLAFMSPHVKNLEGSGREREKLLEKRAREQEDILKQRAMREREGSKL